MGEITRAEIVRVGVDLAKLVIQVHAVDASGRRMLARAFKRDAFEAWCMQLPAGCEVAMEACASAHHWGRKLACVNRIRGPLAEYGLVFAKSTKALRAVLADVIEDASNELDMRARLVLQRAFEHWRELDDHVRWSAWDASPSGATTTCAPC